MFKIRFLWMVLKAFLARKGPRKGVLGFWVTPFDCDMNFHLNNAYYLKFMDLGRYDLVIRFGTVPSLLKAKVLPVVVGVNISYKKSLPPFSYFRLETELLSIEDKKINVRQVFKKGGTVCAEALVTVVVVQNGRAVSTEKFMNLLPEDARLFLKN